MQVEWLQESLEKAAGICQYLEEFSYQAADNFRDRLDKTIQNIVRMPTTGMPSKKKEGIRSMKIDKNRRIYYVFDEAAARIVLVDIFDTRQHPAKNQY